MGKQRLDNMVADYSGIADMYEKEELTACNILSSQSEDSGSAPGGCVAVGDDTREFFIGDESEYVESDACDAFDELERMSTSVAEKANSKVAEHQIKSIPECSIPRFVSVHCAKAHFPSRCRRHVCDQQISLVKPFASRNPFAQVSSFSCSNSFFTFNTDADILPVFTLNQRIGFGFSLWLNGHLNELFAFDCELVNHSDQLLQFLGNVEGSSFACPPVLRM